MDNTWVQPGQVEHDPAILAFVKWHVTSFLRWDVLRLLANQGDSSIMAAEAARQLHKPASDVDGALRELEQEGILQAERSPFGGIGYRLDRDEPTTRVLERLVTAATRSQELRQIIIARIVSGTRVAS